MEAPEFTPGHLWTGAETPWMPSFPSLVRGVPGIEVLPRRMLFPLCLVDIGNTGAPLDCFFLQT